MDSCSRHNIEWKFSPEHSAHFEGIWEAGVKLMKDYLKHVLGNTKLSHENFSNVLVQVESILNSRPLGPSSFDLSDLLHITPANFLLGRSMDSVHDSNYEDINVNHLIKFEQLQQLL